MAERADDDQVTSWALAAGRGDRHALTAFVRATQRDVHRFVAHLSSPREADDLAQETYLRALKSLPDFAGRSHARTWLLAIARYTAADSIRGAARRPRTIDTDDPIALADRVGPVRSAVDEAVLLRALISELPAYRREAFVLTQVLDLSYAEAADVCDCPIGTIRSRVARAREDLAAALFDHVDRRSRRNGST